MALILIPALSAALALWPFHPTQTVTHRYRGPAWSFGVAKDRFTGAVACRVYKGAARAPSVAYARRSVAFAFSPSLSTLAADYRVDSGPVLPWTTVYPTLAQQGATLPGASLSNPTGGLVILPLTAVAGAHTVTIRPTPKSQPRQFDIDGLGDALARARLLGCAADADFVR